MDNNFKHFYDTAYKIGTTVAIVILFFMLTGTRRNNRELEKQINESSPNTATSQKEEKTDSIFKEPTTISAEMIKTNSINEEKLSKELNEKLKNLSEKDIMEEIDFTELNSRFVEHNEDNSILNSMLRKSAVSFDKLTSNNCSNNETIKWNGSKWVCSELLQASTVDSNYISNNDLINNEMIENSTITFSKLNSNGCGNNQIIKWDGSKWVCTERQTIPDPIWSLNETTTYYNNGFVGIGTNTPITPLDISGDTSIRDGALSFHQGENQIILNTNMGGEDGNKLTVDAGFQPTNYFSSYGNKGIDTDFYDANGCHIIIENGLVVEITCSVE